MAAGDDWTDVIFVLSIERKQPTREKRNRGGALTVFTIDFLVSAPTLFDVIATSRTIAFERGLKACGAKRTHPCDNRPHCTELVLV